MMNATANVAICPIVSFPFDKMFDCLINGSCLEQQFHDDFGGDTFSTVLIK